MLNKQDAIRVEPNPAENYPSRVLYIFNCLGCSKELRVQPSGLKRRTGYCVRCVKRYRHPYQTIYNGMLASVKRTNKRFSRDVSCSLTFEEFCFLTQIKTCNYCGNPVHWQEYGPGPYNLDRKDNSKGYELDNVVVCCFECNHRKNRFYTHEEFHAITRFLRTWRKLAPTMRRELEFVVDSFDETQWKWEAVENG